MIICEWKRKGDKVRFFEMEFKTFWELSNFFESLLKQEILQEQLEIRIYLSKDKK